jgi:threonine dehydrogenase-like Zn-dependent dehydrogenase
MAGITRVHGSAVPASFYGLQPTFVKVSVATATWNMHTSNDLVGSNFEKAVKAVQTVGSVVMLGTPAAVSTDSVFIVAVDGATVNNGAGATTAGAWGALKDALASASGAAASAFTITTSSGFSGDGFVTFA